MPRYDAEKSIQNKTENNQNINESDLITEMNSACQIFEANKSCRSALSPRVRTEIEEEFISTETQPNQQFNSNEPGKKRKLDIFLEEEVTVVISKSRQIVVHPTNTKKCKYDHMTPKTYA